MRERGLPQRAIRVPPPAVEAVPSRVARVLVVDDDARNLLTIGEVLKGVGEIDCVQSGEEALRCLLKNEYAVILLDVLMPGLDGYQTAGIIRQRESSKSTPIIFLTAINKEDVHMLRGYDAGAVDFLFKPFDPMMLRSKVAFFIDLFQKTQEIKEKAELEQRLLEENLRANARQLEAERALRRAEERQEAIMRSLPICVHSRKVEAPFGASFVSGAVERLTGFPAERFSEEPGFGLARVHPSDRPQVEQALTEALQTGAYACEFRWQCADGIYRYFLDQGVVALGEDGRPREILGTLLDITERRQLEDQLIHAQKLDAIGKLTGGVAHDFNNLLASILSGLSLLKRRVDMDDAAARIFDMTHHAAEQGAELIKRMLAFSRRQQLSPTTIHLSRLSETFDALVAPVLGGLVQIRWQIDDDTWPAHVDPGQLDLALMNLVINARDAMPDGGAIVVSAENRTVSTAGPDLAGGDYVVLSVEDTGKGIPAELLPKVMEPFFTTKDVGRGTGLGLSTVYGFARQSGGGLRIYSEVGKGTSVELWLPRSKGQPQGLEQQPPPKPAKPRPNGRLPSILLVDDSAELLEFTARTLSDHGFEVACAGGGAEALAMLEREPDRFDLIITDFAMPLVSGMEVIRLARNIRAGWPAVMITGYADAGVIAGRPADVPVLKKPFKPAALIETVEQVYAARRTSRRQARG
jgi:signal transduction histidine kinase/DNA-binding response OmpR family regulator